MAAWACGDACAKGRADEQAVYALRTLSNAAPRGSTGYDARLRPPFSPFVARAARFSPFAPLVSSGELMLQMQAEAWRMQWSVAMQENEELRAKLYDTRNSLEAAGGGGASGEHWRELCISIAKSAEDEKGQILEQIGSMREGREIVGYGMAACNWEALKMACDARVSIRADGTAFASCATQDIGTGTYTIVAQTVSDVTGIPIDRITVKLGDVARCHPFSLTRSHGLVTVMTCLDGLADLFIGSTINEGGDNFTAYRTTNKSGRKDFNRTIGPVSDNC